MAATPTRTQANGVTTGTTAVTVIGAPDGSERHVVQSIVVTNRDTKDAVVIIRVDDGGTKRELRRVTLQAGVAATATLTFSGVAVNTETLVIGGKTYTWEAALADVDGHIDVGVNQAADESNLTAAIDLGAGGGTAYAASMVEHPSVDAADVGSTVVITCIATGAAGNDIVTTEAMANAAWGGGTMSGGVDAESMEFTAPVILSTADQTIEIVLGYPVTTTECDYVASYRKLPAGDVATPGLDK